MVVSLVAGFVLATLAFVRLGLAEEKKPVENGVRLVLSSEQIEPTTTFELRFDDAIIGPEKVGLTAPESPLFIAPEIRGSFVWLSQRSGVFTPDGPPALGVTFQVSLRQGLTKVDGSPLQAELRRSFDTPAMGIIGSYPSPDEARQADASATPKIRVQFNVDVAAATAAKFIVFRNADNKTVPAIVTQAEDDPNVNYNFDKLRTWRQRFDEARGTAGKKPVPVRGEKEKTLKASRLLVIPARPLPIAKGWRIVVGKNLPTTDGPARLPEVAELPIGDVKPFELTEVIAHNLVDEDKWLELAFSKTISPELEGRDALKWVSVSPEPAGFDVEMDGSSIRLKGKFELDKKYQVSVQAGLPASEPFVLADAVIKEAAFTPLPARLFFPALSTAQISGGQRDFQLRSVNAGGVQLRAKLLTADTLIYALNGYKSYTKKYNEPNQNEEPFREVDFGGVPGLTIFDKHFDLSTRLDSVITTPLRWDDILKGHKTGAVFLAAQKTAEESNGRALLGTESLIQLTDIGLVWKQDRGEEAWIYTFSHATGKPIANTKILALTADNETLITQATDTNGLTHFKVPEKTRWLIAENGEDVHAIEFRPVHLDDEDNYYPNERDRFLPLWHFHIPTGGFGGRERRDVLLFSDRPVYQPGETLHLKAIARERHDDQLAIPLALTGHIEFFDARHQKFAEKKFTLSALGSLSESVSLPQSGLGNYSAELRFDDEPNQEHYFSWQVEQYKPNAFEIKIAAKDSYTADEAIDLPISAKYFFGKSLAKAKVHWSLEASDDSVSPSNIEGFNWSNNSSLNDDEKGESGYSQQGELSLDAQGTVTLKPELTIDPKKPQPRHGNLLVEITDLNQQTVSDKVNFTRQSSDFYLGIKDLPDLLTAGDNAPVTVVAIDPEGTPHAAPVETTARLRKINWHVVREEGAGGALTYRSESQVADVSTTPVTTTALVKSGVNWEVADDHPTQIPLAEAGDYLLEVTAKDGAGRAVCTSVRLNASSKTGKKEKTVWPYPNEAQIDLVPDKETYGTGESAKILVKTPISGEALVTVEREKVLRSFVVRLDGNAPSISVPLEANDAPNVFVSVMLVRGFEESTRKIKSPDYRLGYCQLNVERPEQKLIVKVTGDAPHYQPAQEVKVAAEIKDGTGAPAADAEVTLYAVDEGVLSLMGYKTPDPFSHFNGVRSLRVQTGSSLPSLFPEDPEQRTFSNKGYLIGGGGDDSGSERLRKNFLACAFWNAELRTDAAGKVTATFTAPDSLTRYRVIAVAQTAKSQFGSGESSFEINKPLMLEPALPRFGNVGDQPRLRAVLHNTTDAGGEVELTVKLDETAIVAGSNSAGNELNRKVKIAARGSAAIDFPIEFKNAGTATWTWKARMADPQNPGKFFADAIETKLNVGYIAPLLHETLLGRISAPETNLLAQANPQFLEGTGKFTARIANTRLSELNDAVTHLLHYPYGCVEQTTSCMLPWILINDLQKGIPQLKVASTTADDAISRGINRLLEMQTPSGGLAYWPGGREPMLWGSAYGAMAMALAQKHGHSVPVATLDQICNYISKQLRNTADKTDNYELSDRCLAVYALALAGHSEPGYHELLWKKRDALSAENRALLALAILEGKGAREMVNELLDPKKPAPPQAGVWFSSGSRELATRLLAWTQHDAKNLAVDTLAEELLADRNRQGNWGTTQGNAWSLLALARYAADVEGAPKLATGTLRYAAANDTYKLDDTVHVFETEHAIAPGNAPLQLANPAQAQLFTQVRMEARPRMGLQPRQDRGYAIARNYSKLNDDGSLTEAKDLRVGDRVLVTLQVEVRQAAHYLALDDPLPAIFEAVNPKFKSQEMRGRSSLGYESFSDYRELREDRALFFANHIAPNTYTIRYLARVRASGTATAPAAKIEEMYHPERFGLTETVLMKSLALDE